MLMKLLLSSLVPDRNNSPPRTSTLPPPPPLTRHDDIFCNTFSHSLLRCKNMHQFIIMFPTIHWYVSNVFNFCDDAVLLRQVKGSATSQGIGAGSQGIQRAAETPGGGPNISRESRRGRLWWRWVPGPRDHGDMILLSISNVAEMLDDLGMSLL